MSRGGAAVLVGRGDEKISVPLWIHLQGIQGSGAGRGQLTFLCEDVGMEVTALIVSLLSLSVAFGGTYLSNKRAKEALHESRRASADARWSALQEAVQRFIGFDPTAEPIGERLANLRISMIALVDELHEVEGLDEWLEAERVLGATIGRQVMEVAKPGDTVERHLKNLDPVMSWAQALSGNLRHFRSVGFEGRVLLRLRTHAADAVQKLHARHGWDLPPDSNPRLHPLV
ncbi:hypothetical protein [Nesterenkonia sp. Act20]|uniref:hypothetical protein n=1 Tax=Nesterenkonia sp. Act20 TaxID=1483432 RepID=UPI0021005E35|nr:hypothetical protein [Nesterenkonia sp. Act20]